ncbi:hypothetical protein BZB76_0683 [Actinomadura pelletieri DSM 43383]|uniref:SnoaL-like protein n=1 Tax=Actinomadura pelletieri DSM 43383 TaxID=1120940 RepID=A0A495QYL1_9ACTN|nr:hypothetical protein [Actinomadura pelletieri]RKS79233.1 hypothetical protein BZB76_0683 [Actinomadura pelletieri DSM 43383]
MSPSVEAKQLVERYVAQWNEPDPTVRSKIIRELWAPDGVHVLVDPPQAMREAATALAFPVPPLEVRGHEALDVRVAHAYTMFLASGEHFFEAASEPSVLLPHVIAFRWAMLTTGAREVVGGGLDVLALDDEGRIRSDHQYINAT